MRSIAFAAALFALGGCVQCESQPQERRLSLEAMIADAGNGGQPMGDAVVHLVEHSTAEPARVLSALFHNPSGLPDGPLQGHVTQAWIRDASGTVLWEFAVNAPGSIHWLPILPATALTEAQMAAVREAALGDGVFLELVTDIAGKETISVQMQVIADTGWQDVPCEAY